MSNRLDELIVKLLDGELGVEERQELEVYRESNVAARRQIEDAESHLESIALMPDDVAAGVAVDGESGGEGGPKRRSHMPMGIRILAGVLLAAILFGFVMLPFIRFKASMMEVQLGDVRTAMGNKLGALRDEGEAFVPEGATALMEIRGRSMLRVNGPAKLVFKELGPAANIVLVQGSIELERKSGLRECFVTIGKLRLEPAGTGGVISVERLVADGPAMLTLKSGGVVATYDGKPVGAVVGADVAGAAEALTGDGLRMRIPVDGIPEILPGEAPATSPPSA